MIGTNKKGRMYGRRKKRILEPSGFRTADAVTLEAQIVPDVCADSLDTVELSMAIEDKLGVSMPDGLMATMLTIGDLLKYLQENK